MSESSLPHAIVVTWFVDGQIGFLDFAYRLDALSKRYRLTVLCRAPLDGHEVAPPGADVIVLRPRSRGLAALAHYWVGVSRHVRRQRPDLVVHLGSQIAAIANVDLGAPQAIYWNEHPSHYLDRQRPPTRWLGQAMTWLQYRGARRAALVMPIGEAHLEDLMAHGCHPDRTTLVPMGVADAFARPLERPAPPPADPVLRLVYAGAVHVDRGRDLMIDALAVARREGCPVELTLVGVDDVQMKACAERCAQLGVSGSVSLHPRVPGHRIPHFLDRADFGICLWADKTYWRFNPPTKLFEYLAAGLPVLVSDIRTHTAYVRDGEHGFVFAYEVRALADALRRAWSAREHWPALRRAAASIGERYRWSTIEPRFLTLMQGLHA